MEDRPQGDADEELSPCPPSRRHRSRGDAGARARRRCDQGRDLCEGGGAPERQITKPASISKRGSFSASIAYEFIFTHKITAKLFFKGKFAGHAVKGTARSEFVLAKGCDGSTTFSAKTK
jgi:hypothetical protein